MLHTSWAGKRGRSSKRKEEVDSEVKEKPRKCGVMHKSREVGISRIRDTLATGKCKSKPQENILLIHTIATIKTDNKCW